MKKYIWMICCILSFSAVAQIQVQELPASGYAERIRSYIDSMRIIDSHEHLREQSAVKGNVTLDFMLLLHHYAGSDLQSAGLPESLFAELITDKYSIPQKWEIIKPYWQAAKNTAYCRSVINSIKHLFDVEGLNDDTYQELSRKIKEAHNDPNWYQHILQNRSKIDLAVQDVRSLRSAGKMFVHVERFDDFVNVNSKADILDLARRFDFRINIFDDYLQGLDKQFRKALDNNMMGVKSGLAYYRVLHYEEVSREQAWSIFNTMLKAPREKEFAFDEVKPLQDFMMHQVISLIQQHDLPMQIHTGLQAGNGNLITNSNPTHLANLFLQYRDVTFCLFHGGYPYGGELATLAKNFSNVFIDMCWTQIISPSYSIRYLHEWLETVPANKIMAFGGDYQYAENVFGHAIMAKQVVAQVLVEKVATGYLSEQEAIDFADMLLYKNAQRLFAPK